MAESAHHVVPAPNGGWSVKKAGASRASRRFPTKGAAEIWARRASGATGSELVVHNKDGTIERKDFFGRAPLPPRDRR